MMIVGGDVKQLGYSEILGGVREVWYKICKRVEDEAAEVEAGMWDCQVRLIDDLAVVEENVDIYGAGRVMRIEN